MAEIKAINKTCLYCSTQMKTDERCNCTYTTLLGEHFLEGYYTLDKDGKVMCECGEYGFAEMETEYHQEGENPQTVFICLPCGNLLFRENPTIQKKEDE